MTRDHTPTSTSCHGASHHSIEPPRHLIRSGNDAPAHRHGRSHAVDKLVRPPERNSQSQRKYSWCSRSSLSDATAPPSSVALPVIQLVDSDHGNASRPGAARLLPSYEILVTILANAPVLEPLLCKAMPPRFHALASRPLLRTVYATSLH